MVIAKDKLKERAEGKQRLANYLEHIDIELDEQLKPTEPFIDLDKMIRELPNAAIRFAAGSELPTQKQIEEYGLDPERMPEYQVCYWKAAMYLAKLYHAEAITYNIRQIADMCGVSKSAISRIFAGDRPFVFSYPVIEIIAHDVAKVSCHELMFGQPAAIKVPSRYAAMIPGLEKLSESEIRELIDSGWKYSNRVNKEDRTSIKRNVPNSGRDSAKLEEVENRELCAEIFRERMIDYFDEDDISMVHLFDKDVAIRPATRIRLNVCQQEDTILRLVNLMTLTVESYAREKMDLERLEKARESMEHSGEHLPLKEQRRYYYALDYFCANDCLRYCDAFYVKDGEKITITDKNIKTVMRILMMIRRKSVGPYVDKIYSMILGKMLTK